MSSSSRRVARQQVQAPDRLRRGAGQRHVDAVARERALELRAGRAARRAASISASSAWRAWLAALPTAAALLGRQLRRRRAAAAAARPCGRGSARAAPRAPRCRAAAAIAASASRAQLCDPLDHDARTLDECSPHASSRTAPPSPPSRRSATPRRSGCARCARSAATHLLGQPVALGADQQRRRAARDVAGGPAQRARGASGEQRDALARQLAERRCTRASATAKIAPMLARTAFGEYGSAQPGPSATHEAPKACAERSDVPTLPGSPTPCRYTHSGPRGAPQRCS